MWVASIIIAVISGIIFGVATDKVVDNKGYSENWFWWGFFFGIIALIVALSKPDISQQSFYSSAVTVATADKQKNEILENQSWRCSRCGRVNSRYTGTCGCGISRVESERWLSEKQKEEKELENAQKLKAFKDLLDAGVISSEEFEKKKAELLR